MNPRLDWRERQKARQVERHASRNPFILAAPKSSVSLSDLSDLIKRAMERTPCEELPHVHHRPPRFCPHCRGKVVALSDFMTEVRELLEGDSSARGAVETK